MSAAELVLPVERVQLGRSVVPLIITHKIINPYLFNIWMKA